MSSLGIKIRPGSPIFDQVVSGAQRAILSRELEKGQSFPSVRSLAAGLKIHPNTAHKAVQYLIQERWLEVQPGIGTVVVGCPRKPSEMRRYVIEQDVAMLVTEARRVGLELEELIDSVRKSWSKTRKSVEETGK
jgi:DNA-binding transcriptional regulator YhcF (GntR family)